MDAGAVVTKDVKPYALAHGTPARQHGWACECGEKLPVKKSKAACRRCGKKYKVAKLSLLKI